MGNQLYKLHILHNSTLITMTIPPDHTVLQLREAIQSNTGVDPCQQVLFCGSQILRMKNKDSLEKTEVVNGSTMDRTCVELGNIEIQVLGFEKMSSESRQKLLVLEKKGPIFPIDRQVEYENVKSEIGTLKQHLVELIEGLDKMKISEDDLNNKTRKKEIAYKIRTVLDQIEKIHKNIKKSLDEIESHIA
eukprot:GFUD01039674.1.p1 GENE.GFUD01039674.1~~GFUD01039674.1.p1  ORF type:complete len:190 (+),score=60.23 GFUD01039674.1:263-832(+)